MSRRKNTTDRRFRDQLRQFEAAPPDEVWRGISSALELDKRKKQVLWIRRIAASIAVILAVGTIWILLRESPETKLVIRDTPEADSQEMPQADDRDTPEAESRDTPEAESRDTPAEANLQSVPAENGIREKQVNLADANMPAPQGETLSASTEGNGTVSGDQVHAGLLKPVPRRSGTGFQTEFTDPQTLLAMSYYKSTLPEESEGIDVFEEWGEDGQASHDKWGVGTQVSPVYSYRNLEVSDGNTAGSSYYNDLEDGIVTYAGGVNVQYAPLKRLSIQTGLHYSRTGMKVGNAYYAQLDERNTFMDAGASRQASINNSTGTIEMPQSLDNAYLANEVPLAIGELASISMTTNTLSDANGEILQHFEYLELPVILRYRVVDRRLGFHLLSGLSTNFLVGSKAYYQEDGNKKQIGTTADLKPVNYSGIMGVGVDYSISKRFHINLEPTFRLYLNSINSDSMIKSYPYAIGFYTGILYTF